MKQPLLIFISLLLLTACNGIDLGCYDNDTPDIAQPIVEDSVVTGEISIDASNWKEWFYVDLHAIHDEIVNGGVITETFPAYPTPMTATEKWDGKSGIFYYWYDVYGQGGVAVHQKSDSTFYKTYGVSDIHTDPQPEPEKWDFAIHRDNVRTNGGAAYETSAQDISIVGEKDTDPSLSFTTDSWNETDVWTENTFMLTGNIGNQAISINPVLSKWLTLTIPPFPPSFNYNGDVFILRMKDGKYAALRLKDYVNAKTGTKCYLTIEFKYPLKSQNTHPSGGEAEPKKNSE